jgi:hypothetical protein
LYSIWLRTQREFGAPPIGRESDETTDASASRADASGFVLLRGLDDHPADSQAVGLVATYLVIEEISHAMGKEALFKLFFQAQPGGMTNG